MKVLKRKKKEVGFSINVASRICSIKHPVSNKRRPLISAAPLNTVLIRIVPKFY